MIVALRHCPLIAMLPAPFTVADISTAVGPASFARGRNYHQRGSVLGMYLVDDVIEGTVEGSRDQVYSQTISVRTRGRGVEVDGACSCPMDFNCKHVAAVLLTYLENEGAAAGGNALPYAVGAWLEASWALGAPAPAPAQIQYRMVYALTHDTAGVGPELLFCRARLDAGGAIVGATIVTDLAPVITRPPVYMRDDDLALMRMFSAVRGNYWSRERVIPDDTFGGHLLTLLLDGGRLFWIDEQAGVKVGALRPLARARERAGVLDWQAGADGQLQLDWRFEDAGGAIAVLVPTTPPFYIDGAAMGLLRLDPAASARPLKQVTEMVRMAPKVSAAHAPALAKAMRARGIDTALPLPYRAQQLRRSDIAPRPYLQLGAIALANGEFERVDHDYAMLTFDYDGMRTAAAAADAPLERATLEGSELIDRDIAAETAAAATLAALGFAPATGPLKLLNGALALGDGVRWRAFERAPLAALRAQGWQVEMAPTYRYNLVEIDDWVADVAEASEDGGNPWFSLDLGIVVDGARVALLPLLVQMIRAAPRDFDPAALAVHADGASLLARLADGRRVALPWSRVRPILATLGELYFTDRVDDGIALAEIDAARLAELEAGAQLRWLGGGRLRALGRKLARFDGVQPVAPPAGLQATLRPRPPA